MSIEVILERDGGFVDGDYLITFVPPIGRNQLRGLPQPSADYDEPFDEVNRGVYADGDAVHKISYPIAAVRSIEAHVEALRLHLNPTD